MGIAASTQFSAPRARLSCAWLAFRCVVLLSCLGSASLAWAQGAAGAVVSESTVKAAFLYKFASYVQWPDEPAGGAAAPLTIGVIGAGDFARELGGITSGRTVADRPITVRPLEPGDSLGDLDVLFIGQSADDRLAQLLAPARSLPILTVTESAGALADGSIINFAVDRERVRFDVSLNAAERSRLKLNSRLLAVARRVYREPQ